MKKTVENKILIILMMGLIAFGTSGCGVTGAETSEDGPADEVEISVGEDESPEKEGGTDIGQIMEEEDSEAAIMGYAKEAAPDIDISGCDTFTHIVDRKLAPGMGYANVDIGDVNALIVCSGAYDNMDGNMAAIDGTVFVYKDGMPYQAGKICSGGTAYPLSIKDGKLMSASNHWVAKYMIVEDQVVMVEHGAVEYDSNGEGSYSYDRIDDFSDGSEIGEAQAMVDGMFAEMGDGEVINFDVIQ